MDAPTDRAGHDVVFVAGMHRSGTTLLAQLIGSSTESSGLTGTGVQMDEGQFLQDVFPIGKQMGGVSAWAFDDRAYLTERDADLVPDAGDRLWASWSPYWDLGKTHLVEKTPLNLTRTRFLQAAFPGSRFVVITRHPITQALAVRKWSPRLRDRMGFGVERLVRHWVRAHEAFAADRGELQQCHVVRYEHLLADPVAEAQRLRGFLGFDIDTTLLADLDAARGASYRRTWESAFGPGARTAALRRVPATRPRHRRAYAASVRTLADTVSLPRAAGRFDDDLRARVRALGYDLDALDAPLPEFA